MLLGKFRRGKFTQMIEKVVNNRNLKDFSSIREDLDYWLSKTPEERVAAVDYLRRQYLSWKYS